MLVQLGQRATAPELVDLLSECHGRIRRFLSLASKLASTADVSDAEAAEVATQIRRYFTLSFPLHLADEDESIIPALADDPTVRPGLARMHADHVAHEPLVNRLVAACSAIERAPHTLSELRAELRAASELLSAALEPHLVLEECDIFPAIRRLPRDLQDRLHAAMRARRAA